MTKGDNPYDILGVPRSASEADIKAAYRKAAKKYQPDKQLTERNRERASAMFPRIHVAYETMTSDTT
jgi:DnaJ-class molecular chaperone